jgi:hypothetical protein
MEAYTRPTKPAFSPAQFREQAHCPFGCRMDDEGVDQNGYCRHLVGFTNDGKTMEPLVKHRFHQSHGAPQPVRKDDVLVRVTVSYRVYRNVDAVYEYDSATVLEGAEEQAGDESAGERPAKKGRTKVGA